MARSKQVKTPFPSLISASDLAKLLGYSRRRIMQFAAEGTLVRVGHGSFDAADAVQAIIRHREQVVGKRAEEALAAAKGDRVYDEAKSRWMTEKARTAEIQRLEREAKLVPVDQLQYVAGALITNCKSHLLAIPSRFASVWSTVRSAVDAQRILTEYVHEGLECIAATHWRIDGIDDDDEGRQLNDGQSPA